MFWFSTDDIGSDTVIINVIIVIQNVQQLNMNYNKLLKRKVPNVDFTRKLQF